MRKNNFKLIRKTLEWLHRKRGTASLKMPMNVPEESYKYFKMFGSGSGVGDYNSATKQYDVPIHIHGKNLMGGQEFADIHYNLAISKITGSVTSGFYSTTPLPEHNGTVVIGPEHVKFKKKTAYTLALHLKFVTSATSRKPGLRFDYSDGSYDFNIISTNSREFRVCLTSDPTKDLVAISSHAESAANTRYGVDGFGLYEGAYSDYDAIHEAYSGQRISLSLPFPLRKINYTKDTVDLISGTVTKKTRTVVLDETSEPVLTEREGVFFIPLSENIRPSSRIESDFEELTESSESGICPSNDGTGILFKASPDVQTEDDMREYLSAYPLEISYVLRTYENIAVTPLQISAFTNEVTMEILSSSEPSAIIAEYRD